MGDVMKFALLELFSQFVLNACPQSLQLKHSRFEGAATG